MTGVATLFQGTLFQGTFKIVFLEQSRLWTMSSWNSLPWNNVATPYAHSLNCKSIHNPLFSGASVKVNMICNSGHRETWESSVDVGSGKWKMPNINLLLIFFTLMSGLQFDPLKVDLL